MVSRIVVESMRLLAQSVVVVDKMCVLMNGKVDVDVRGVGKAVVLVGVGSRSGCVELVVVGVVW